MAIEKFHSILFYSPSITTWTKRSSTVYSSSLYCFRQQYDIGGDDHDDFSNHVYLVHRMEMKSNRSSTTMEYICSWTLGFLTHKNESIEYFHCSSVCVCEFVVVIYLQSGYLSTLRFHSFRTSSSVNLLISFDVVIGSQQSFRLNWWHRRTTNSICSSPVSLQCCFWTYSTKWNTIYYNVINRITNRMDVFACPTATYKDRLLAIELKLGAKRLRYKFSISLSSSLHSAFGILYQRF